MQLLVLTLSQGRNNLATSALPNAPVVPERPRRAFMAGSRQRTATALRSAAAWLDTREPEPARA